MTKTEFQEQFKRLRVAGYRLPVFDGITIADVIAEWYGTFGSCSKEEFSEAIDRLKKDKTDTFWPATGELWAHVYEFRKARRIRLQAQSPDYDDRPLTPEQSQEFVSMFRQFQKQLVKKMAMPHAEPQQAPQAAIDAELIAEEDREHAAKGEVCG